MDVDNKPAPLKPKDSTPDLSRRGFVKNSGKALYLAPTLTVLGAAPAAAQFGSPPPPPGGAAPPAPGAPAPNQ
jgi:hypothetical protein